MWYNGDMDDWCFYEWTTVIGVFIGFLAAIGTIALAFLAFRTIREGRRSLIAERLNEWARKYLDKMNRSNAPAKTKSIEIFITNEKSRLSDIVDNISATEIDAAKFSSEVYKKVRDIIEISKKGIALDIAGQEKETIFSTFENIVKEIDNHLRFIIDRTS